MRMRAIFCLLLLAVVVPAVANADQYPTFKGPLSASEKAFVSSIQADLNARFATESQAERAGYFRYTNADETGAISYANLQWTSKDIQHPSQLWYDKHGNLLGADFSEPVTSPTRPQVFGVNPGRWYLFDDHIHWIGMNPATGASTYDNYVMAGPFVKAGGSLKTPSAATLEKMGKVKNARSVKTVFDFPKVWDLIVWTKPNPLGAFAVKNPNVKP
jgi:hypothetical protein